MLSAPGVVQVSRLKRQQAASWFFGIVSDLGVIRARNAVGDFHSRHRITQNVVAIVAALCERWNRASEQLPQSRVKTT